MLKLFTFAVELYMQMLLGLKYFIIIDQIF